MYIFARTIQQEIAIKLALAYSSQFKNQPAEGDSLAILRSAHFHS